jgi:LTXXQ motif family protein
MKKRFLTPLAVALALSTGAALVSTAGFAQPRPGAAADAEARKAPRERPTRIEGRIAFLRAELGITEMQAPLFDAVAEAMRRDDAAQRELRRQVREARQARDARPNAVERLELRQHFAEARLAGMRELTDAVRPLYAALDAGQQRTADELLARQFRRGHGKRGGHH